MSISNFSVSHNPDGVFLQTLEEKVAERLQKLCQELSGLSGQKLQEAQTQILFDLERFRLQQIEAYCCQKEPVSGTGETESALGNSMNIKARERGVFFYKEKPEANAGKRPSDKSGQKKKSVFVSGTNTINLLQEHKKRSSLNQAIGMESIFPSLGGDRGFRAEKGILPLTFAVREAQGSQLQEKRVKFDRLKEEGPSEEDEDAIEDEDQRSEICSLAQERVFLMEKLDKSVESVLSEDETENQTALGDKDLTQIDCLAISLIKQKGFQRETDSERTCNVLWPLYRLFQKSQLANESELQEEKEVQKCKFDLDYCSDQSMTFLAFNGKFLTDKVSNREKQDLIIFSSETKIDCLKQEKYSLLVSDIEILKAQVDEGIQSKISSFSTISLCLENETEAYSPILNSKYLILQKIKRPLPGTQEKHLHGICRDNSDLLNEVSIQFDPTDSESFGVKVNKGFYGAYVNLNRRGFSSKRLLIESGMTFLINEKTGFCISEIIKSDETKKRDSILKEFLSRESFQAFPTNIENTKFAELILALRTKYTKNDFKSSALLFKHFCADQLAKQAAQDLIVISFIEFFPEYKIYKVHKDCILFVYQDADPSFSPFFKNISNGFGEFSFGFSLYSTLKRFNQGRISALGSFFAPYDLQIGFNKVVERFYLSYPRAAEEIEDISYCSLFDDGKARLSFGSQFVCSKLDPFLLAKEEGVWVLLSRFNLLVDSLKSDRVIKVPFGSMLMFEQNVVLVEKRKLLVCDK